MSIQFYISLWDFHSCFLQVWRNLFIPSIYVCPDYELANARWSSLFNSHIKFLCYYYCYYFGWIILTFFILLTIIKFFTGCCDLHSWQQKCAFCWCGMNEGSFSQSISSSLFFWLCLTYIFCNPLILSSCLRST